LAGLQVYSGETPFKPGMGVLERMKTWARECGELLSAETIMQQLPELNRQILFSLQKFMVRTGLVKSMVEPMFTSTAAWKSDENRNGRWCDAS
jgi:hypothetical protein